MSAPQFDSIHKLGAADGVDFFDCGETALNQFLQRYALSNQRANSVQTYVCCESSKVVGFYTLTVGSVDHLSAPERVVKGLAQHPVPVIILARLAVDRVFQGGGLGRALLKDALRRTLVAADIAGIRAVLVHAKDDAARQWYQGFDFSVSTTDPFHLFLILKDIKALLVE